MSQPIIARCGSAEPHGAHMVKAAAWSPGPAWCAGNRDVLTEAPEPVPGSGPGWDGTDRCTWRDHRACEDRRIGHVAPCPFATEPTCSVPGCHDEQAHEAYRQAADRAADYRERAATMQRRALAASIEANRAERAWRETMAPKPTCRHCGAPDLAPWDASDAGMAGDYCARCVDDAVLGAPCPACGNVPGDDDPCPSR